MKFRIFKKEFELTTKQLFKFIAFCFFVSISAYLSLNMFIQLGHEFSEKVAMVAISIGVEAFKVFLAISLSTSVFTTIYYAKRWFETYKKNKTSSIKKPNHYSVRVITNSVASILFLFLYLITAFTSLTASLGYALTTVNRYTEERQTVDNTVSIDALKSANSGYGDTITSYKSIIESSNKTLAAYDIEIAKVQPIGQEWRTGSAFNAKAALQKKIDEYNNKIIDLRTKITDNETKITDLKLAQNSTAGNTSTKSMFELIANQLKGKDAAWVMFRMIAILSIVIELGILTTSPHGDISGIEEKEIEKEETLIEKKNELKKKKQRKPREAKKVDVNDFTPNESTIQQHDNPPLMENVSIRTFLDDFVEVASTPIEESFVETVPYQMVVAEPEPVKVEEPIKAKLPIIQPPPPKKEEVINIIAKKKQVPAESVNANIEDVLKELDKVQHKDYTEEEKKSGLLNLLENNRTSTERTERLKKLAENI